MNSSRDSETEELSGLLAWFADHQSHFLDHKLPSAKTLPPLTEKLQRLYDLCTDPSVARYNEIQIRFAQLSAALKILHAIRELTDDDDRSCAIYDTYFKNQTFSADALETEWRPIVKQVQTLLSLGATSRRTQNFIRKLLGNF